MQNNIDINVINNPASCHVELLNKDNNKSVNFSLTNTALLKRGFKVGQDTLKAYNLQDKAIIEATTYTNNVILDVQAENMTLVSEEINRVAILSNGEPVSMVTAIKVVDENNKELRYSLQPQEHSVELKIEEEITKALVIIECAPYIDIKSDNALYLRTFGELDYWFDGAKSELYKVNKYNHKELVVKMDYSHISSASYIYQYPAMISETVFFTNYKKSFFKINGSTITKIKDDATFFGFTYLYDNLWIGSTKNGNVYDFKLIEFTDIETATYEVRDTHTIDVGQSASEYFYAPYVVYNHNDKLIVSFYSYQYDSYKPTTPQKISAKINKLTKTFDFTGIDDNSILEYEDLTYNMQFKFSDKKHYVNGVAISGYHSSVTKPLTIPQNGIYEGRTISYDCGSSEYVKIDMSQGKLIESKSSFMQKMWVNGSVGGVNQIDGRTATSAWHVLKDTDVAKRSIATLGEEAFIIPEGVENRFSINLKARQSVFLKKEYAQNKLFILSAYYTNFNTKQSGKLVPYQVPTSEYTDIEIYAEKDFPLDKKVYIISEEKDYNVFVSMCDTKRIVNQTQFNLSINENTTMHDKVDNKYNLLFSEWAANNESFEATPKINFRGDMTLATLSETRASEGTKSLFLTSNYTEKKFLEFDTLSDKISFKCFPHTYKYSSEFYIYINGIQKESITDYDYNRWEPKEYLLNPNKVSTIRFEYYKYYENQADRDNGYYIDEINCNVLNQTNKATVYFKVFDLGMNSGAIGINLLFNGLEKSTNITQANFYSIDNGLSWLPLNGSLPNVDNILLKVEFTKPTVEEEAFVRFDSVTVMPGEFEVTTYADTLRRTYSNHPIETVSTTNSTVNSLDGRYNLLFKDGDLLIEDFESDTPKIPYNNVGPKGVGEFEFSTKYSNSGRGMKMFFLNNSQYTPQPFMEYTIKAKKVSFWYLCSLPRLNAFLRVSVNGKRVFEKYENNEEMKYHEIELDDSIDSVIKFEYFKQNDLSWGDNCVYLDDITFSSLVNTDYSYTESEPVDLTLFPKPIKCNIQVNDLQSTSELTQTYFYSVDNGEWQPFIDTLPNVANVRIKTVFTKASVDEVVTASFKSITIVQEKEDIGPKEIIVLSKTKRVVSKDNNINVYLIRKVVTNIIKSLDTTRKVNRLTRKSVSVDTKRVVIRAFEHSSSFDSMRKIIKNAIVEARARRLSYKDIVAKFKSRRRVAIDKLNSILTERIIIKQSSTKVNADTTREIIKLIINRPNLLRKTAINNGVSSTTSRKVTNLNIKKYDTTRMVNAMLRVEKSYDTKRTVYKPGALYVTQLNITYKLEKGLLRLESQEFN